MPEQDSPKVVTLDNKKYNFDSLTDDLKNEIRGLQVCESQLRFHQDNLKLLTIARQSIANKLKDQLKDVETIE